MTLKIMDAEFIKYLIYRTSKMLIKFFLFLIVFLVVILTIRIVLLLTPRFYIVNGFKFTTTDTKIILGKWTPFITSQTTDYLEIDYTEALTIYFIDDVNFAIQVCNKDSSIIKNQEKYHCVDFLQGYYGSFDYKYPIEKCKFKIEFTQAAGHFWPFMYYKKKNGRIKYIYNYPTFYWRVGEYAK